MEREGAAFGSRSCKSAWLAFLSLWAEKKKKKKNGKKESGEGKVYLVCILLGAQPETFRPALGKRRTEVHITRIFLLVS